MFGMRSKLSRIVLEAVATKPVEICQLHSIQLCIQHTRLYRRSTNVKQEDEAVWRWSSDHVLCTSLEFNHSMIELSSCPSVAWLIVRSIPVEGLRYVVRHGTDAAPPSISECQSFVRQKRSGLVPASAINELNEWIHVHPTASTAGDTLIRDQRHILLPLMQAPIRIDH
jgi:ligand-binding SRPBCC domain-containing protein